MSVVVSHNVCCHSPSFCHIGDLSFSWDIGAKRTDQHPLEIWNLFLLLQAGISVQESTRMLEIDLDEIVVLLLDYLF